ncbi:thioredoxin-dependent thiol peroxidase [Cerasicoccus arenae]|uniref:thioredoxin-dependent peroxiredoxin n=1 Tax=Cerasicoccus arenae TaxID=424488 RepID=A0A8J3GDK5_9BACT|nr:thioredoxin-dependent thiol peroxidase [Cerasicoccus arenae]MBK1859639.1 thioredoxin-dependent thiol peroxidase [Cerasicoccus arenae]GHB96418.1 peroxiredoxin [Cerasicoccus arenae]
MNTPTLLSPGEQSPSFDFRYANGLHGHTDELTGPYLVYFYPRDDTPGCTKEACAFRDKFSDFNEAGLTVIGVSCDDEISHDKFRQKFNLPFPLVADTDQTLVNAFGVWGMKKFMGKEYEGIHRISFLVGPDGVILKTYPKVKPDEHAEEVLRDAHAHF